MECQLLFVAATKTRIVRSAMSAGNVSEYRPESPSARSDESSASSYNSTPIGSPLSASECNDQFK